MAARKKNKKHRPTARRRSERTAMLSTALTALHGQAKAWSASSASSASPNHDDALDLLPVPRPGLFRTPGAAAWIRVVVDDHLETHPLRSKRFSLLLRMQLYQHMGTSLSKSQASHLIDDLEMQALTVSPVEDVHSRVCGDRNRIVIDLGDPRWRCVVITPNHVRVLDYHPFAFARSAHTQALPDPDLSLSRFDPSDLHPSFGTDRALWCLVGAWLVGCLRPWGSFGLLSLVAEAGSGKTTIAKRLLSVVDPTTTSLRQPPRTERDIAAAVTNARVLAYDNFSSISGWLSDAFCRLATGVSLAQRTLYTTADEHVISARVPLMISGIADVVEATDLRDRTLVVRLARLDQDARLTDVDIEDRWRRELAPRLFSTLLRALSIGLGRLATVKLKDRPRMLDHLQFAVACAPGLGVSDEEMVQAHHEERLEGAREIVDESPFGRALVRLVYSSSWTGTAAELLRVLEQHRPRGDRSWPTSARQIGAAIRKLSPDLRRVGIEVDHHFERSRAKRRLITLSRLSSASSGSSGSSAA